MKNIRIFYLKIVLFFIVKFSIYLNRRVFVMYAYQTGRMSRLILVFARRTCHFLGFVMVAHIAVS